MKKLAGLAAALAVAFITLIPVDAEALRDCRFRKFETEAAITARSDNDCVLAYALDTDTYWIRANASWVELGSDIGVGSSKYTTAKVTLTLAEMTALRATNKTLVAAQGASTVIVPVSVLFFLDYGSAQFTESADNLALNYVGAAGDVACTAFETTGSWLVAAADGYGMYTCDQNILATTAQAVNTALTLDNNGDGEFGGGTGSTVTVWITYYVVDVS